MTYRPYNEQILTKWPPKTGSFFCLYVYGGGGVGKIIKAEMG